MHSFSSRLNAVFAFLLSTLAATTFLCFASTYYNNNVTGVGVSVAEIEVMKMKNFMADHSTSDLARFRLNIDAILAPVFNWNVKQLFVYLYVEYTSPSNAINQVVLWDKIVLREDRTTIKLRNAPLKYYFFDDGTGLIGNNATLKLAWNLIPNAGNLPYAIGEGTPVFDFPDFYTPTRRS